MFESLFGRTRSPTRRNTRTASPSRRNTRAASPSRRGKNRIVLRGARGGNRVVLRAIRPRRKNTRRKTPIVIVV